MTLLSLVLFWSGLGVGLLIVVWLIAADKTRYLTRFDLSMWREKYYLRALPNFLEALRDHHFQSPWPARCNAVSAAYYRYRLRPVLRARPVFKRRQFVKNHLTLCALLETLRPYISDYILKEQVRIVGAHILDMEDTVERDYLMAFLDGAKRYRAAFYRSLTSFDHAILVTMIDRRFIPTLRVAHAVFQEHGFSLVPELNALRDWEEKRGADLVTELPRHVMAWAGEDEGTKRTKRGKVKFV